MNIEVDWRRLECGLWECKEGDIRAAYSADRKDSIRPPFTHEGKTYTSMGHNHSGIGGRNEAYCYELKPFIEGDHEKIPYSHEGEIVKWKGSHYRLGPKVAFIASQRTVEEWQKNMRTCYEKGGAFTSNKTYHDLLHQWSEREQWAPKLQRDVAVCVGMFAIAISRELAFPDFTKHKTEEPIQLTDEDNREAMQFAGLVVSKS